MIVTDPTPIPPQTGGWVPPPQAITVAQNTDQTIIIVSEDRARLCIGKHIAMAGRRIEWVAPAGLLVTLVATLVAADFKDILLPKSVWMAMFILAAIGCGLWLIASLQRRGKIPDDEKLLDAIVSRLKAP
jgi:hypothetical protein